MKPRADIEARYRSLLQKAVRRGHVDIVYTTSALLDSLGSKEKNWFRTAAAVITLEECWPLGCELVFNRKFHSKVAALIKVTRAAKSRDAAGLGYMAHALSEGDTTISIGAPDDRDVKIVANAIRRPDDFWRWVAVQKISNLQMALVDNAMRFKNEGLSRDKAVIQATAYLAASRQPPALRKPPASENVFPYWITFDKHTAEGKLALRDVARDLHIPLPQLEWTGFYFEGAKTNAEIPSRWWDLYCRWRFHKIGLPVEEAHLLWEPARPQVIAALADESRRLQNELYRWKLANRERVESLKRQVELFIQHFEEGYGDQMALFGEDQLDNL